LESRCPYSRRQDGGDVGGYAIIEAIMKVYAIGKQRYVVSFSKGEVGELKQLRSLYSLTNIQIIKEIIRWGLNFFFNSKQD